MAANGRMMLAIAIGIARPRALDGGVQDQGMLCIRTPGQEDRRCTR